MWEGEGKAGSAASTRAGLDHSGDAGCGSPRSCGPGAFRAGDGDPEWSHIKRLVSGVGSGLAALHFKCLLLG